MKKYIFYFIFCLGWAASVTAQNLNSYQYVRVPEKFDFLQEENQYQLNALTAFLFEKYGFETLYKKSTPQGVNPCDVLQAKVHKESGLFKSKIYVTLENCENQTVFTTKTGSSREKDFKASYQEALRDAFVSIENLNYTRIEKNSDAEKVNAEKPQPREIIVDPVVTSEEIEEVATERTSSEANKTSPEKLQTQKFTNGPVTYRLEQTTSGYDLYREGEKNKFASLMKSGGGDNFLYSSKNISGNAFFDRQGNLVVEYLDPNSQQLITVNYILQAQ